MGDVSTVVLQALGPNRKRRTVVSGDGSSGGGDCVEFDTVSDELQNDVVDAFAIDEEAACVQRIDTVANDEIPVPALGSSYDEVIHSARNASDRGEPRMTGEVLGGGWEEVT